MATVPDPPPPYTLNANEEPLSPVCNQRVRLSRYLLDILAFTYDVDLDALDRALSNTSLASKHAREPGVVSILSSNERKDLLGLSRIVQDARKKVYDQELASVSSQRWIRMYHEIVLPSISLNLLPAVALDKIKRYLDHQNDTSKRNRTILFFIPFNWRKPSTWFNPFIWSCYYSYDTLARYMVSDELLCQTVAPNDKVRLIIIDAISAARNEYLPPKSHATSIARRFNQTLLSLQLLEQIEIRREQRTAAELLPLVDQLWDLLCANRGFPTRVPNGTPMTYEILRRQT